MKPTDRAVSNSPGFACPDIDEEFDPVEDGPYCIKLPSQLKYWDATALRRFQECPRKYQLMQVEGWNKKGSIDLEFGTLYHEACEMYDKLRLAGADQQTATTDTFNHMARKGICLDTSYLPSWGCSSPAEVIGPRSGKLQRNTKRCDLAKSVQFDGGHRNGEPCPSCGSATFDDYEMVSPHPGKNRNTLLRTVLYYCDTTNDNVKPYKFPDGTAAVELSFSLPLPLESPDGDPYMLTGNLDGMVEFAGEVVPRERKTTRSTPSGYFFDRYSPDIQVDTYDLASYLLYSDLLDPKPHGVMVEATQVTKDISRIERQIVNVPEERREEHLQDLLYWIKQAEDCARADYYPKNASACSQHMSADGTRGGCPMREICAMAPSSRERFLPGEKWEQRHWNPKRIR